MDRRTFLRGIAAAAAGGVVASPFEALAHDRGRRRRRHGGRSDYGPLSPTPDRTTGWPLLALPEGFSYLSMSWRGDALAGGGVVPARHDGGAALRGRRGLVHYVRNHELTTRIPFAPDSATYDPIAGGGTTTVVFDPHHGRLVETVATLSGTIRNCAGGPTPWNTWLSCEETLAGPPTFAERHGFVFEVPALGLGDPRPLRGLGRFSHEAVAVNPWTGIVYLTEDRTQSGLYRFVPDRYGHLRDGGRLEMLRILGAPNFDTGQGLADGSSFAVDWVPIADPESSPFAQGAVQGGAIFRRGEGIWYGGGGSSSARPPGAPPAPARSGSSTRGATSSRFCSSRPAAPFSTDRTTSRSVPGAARCSVRMVPVLRSTCAVSHATVISSIWCETTSCSTRRRTRASGRATTARASSRGRPSAMTAAGSSSRSSGPASPSPSPAPGAGVRCKPGDRTRHAVRDPGVTKCGAALGNLREGRRVSRPGEPCARCRSRSSCRSCRRSGRSASPACRRGSSCTS